MHRRQDATARGVDVAVSAKRIEVDTMDGDRINSDN